MNLLLALHDHAPWFFHYLDVIAMCFTSSSTWFFAAHRRWATKVGFVNLLCGSVLWACVGLLATFGGRPVVGMLIGSANTFVASVIGLWRLRQERREFAKQFRDYATNPRADFIDATAPQRVVRYRR